ncbi:H-NS family nucleoid-associated regulatory protein [Paraburkholderia tuberum]|uniref:DNA-binding protein H-NS n=1 Tax=Paraburkholderia tuberum TaxID=157910 RepID=A0A1H1JCI3_9BURK|nr:H-NS family nucleoid-associated regulatory protein [Paraburkholderia tuberum]SDR47704.1 DNA-binding protein H-NS [Paraburkholderia tuberum]
MPSLEQIQAKLKKLQEQADLLIARKAQAAVDQIRELMLKHGLTTADLEAQAKARRAARALNGNPAGRGRPAGASKAARSATPAKYRDHKTGATWTGHGRAPGWIAGVKDRTAFLIDAASASKPAAAPAAKGGKGQPKGAQPPKYLNPKTGATWSGRGPAPAWLAAVKDRSKFLIDDASMAAAPKAAKTAAKSSQAKATASAVGKKTAAKKATRKTAVKKTAAKKATPASRKAAVKKTAGRKSVVKAARKAPARKAAAKSTAAPVAAAPQTPETQASA